MCTYVTDDKWAARQRGGGHGGSVCAGRATRQRAMMLSSACGDVAVIDIATYIIHSPEQLHLWHAIYIILNISHTQTHTFICICSPVLSHSPCMQLGNELDGT